MGELDVLSEDHLFDCEAAARVLFEAAKELLASVAIRNVIKTIAERLPALHAHDTRQAS